MLQKCYILDAINLCLTFRVFLVILRKINITDEDIIIS